MKSSWNEKTSIEKIPRETEKIHITRPVPVNALKKILKKCPNLKEISISNSARARLSAKTVALMSEKRVKVFTETDKGRPISIPLEKMRQAIEMRRDFRTLRSAEEVTGIPKSTIHYLEKYSKRRKIKKGNTVIYLNR